MDVALPECCVYGRCTVGDCGRFYHARCLNKDPKEMAIFFVWCATFQPGFRFGCPSPAVNPCEQNFDLAYSSATHHPSQLRSCKLVGP